MAIKRRIRVYWAILISPAWRWLVLSPFAMVGVFDTLTGQFWPSDQSTPKVLDILPSLSWQTWVIILLVVAFLILLESAYRFVIKVQGLTHTDERAKLPETFTALEQRVQTLEATQIPLNAFGRPSITKIDGQLFQETDDGTIRNL